MFPPTSLMLDRPFPPSVSGFGEPRVGEVARFKIARWRDQTLHMAAAVQHEFGASAEEPRSVIAGAPSANVIGHPGQDKQVARDLREIDRRLEDLNPTRFYQRIAEEEFQKIF